MVEDSLLLRTVLRDLIEPSGFHIIEAPDGKEGLATALREHPDLILLDLIMPVMDGVTMYKFLRHDKWGASVPVIMLTDVKDDTVLHWMDNTNLDFMLKADSEMVDIVERIKKALHLT